MLFKRISLVTIFLVSNAVSLSVNVDDAELIARALEVNAAVHVNPVQERGLGLVGNILNGVGDVVGTVAAVVATVLGVPVTTSTTIAVPVVVPTTTAANNNGGNSPAPTPTPNNGSGNSNVNSSPGTTSAAGNNNGNNANPAPSNAGNSVSASGSANSVHGVSDTPLNAAVYSGSGVLSIVTDEHGHTIVATAPVTLTYVTTLPNGVVSTVTEVVTPSSVPTSGPSSSPLSVSKIAAVVGTLVTVFLIIFSLTLVLLLLRKRRRAQQIANSSRPESSMSFGSSDLLHDARRDSNAPLAPTASVASFRTAKTFIDGEKMEFPLPPVPSIAPNHLSSNQMASTSNRPLSMGSEAASTFDLTERRSRTSLIADRNFYRKIGQYPAAGTYTPFAFAPSSSLGHSEDLHGNGRISPTALSAALDKTRGFHNEYRRSRNMDENPFSDPITIAQPTVPAPVASTSQGNDGANPNTRQSMLWRKATFGSSKPSTNAVESHPPSSFHDAQDTFGRKASVTSVGRESRTSTEYETATEAHSVHTSGGYSYHSAFARYATEMGADSDNPFADANATESTTSGSRPPSSRVLASSLGWRPTTAKSTATLSVMSSGANSDPGRELGSTPDPKDLFYHPPSTGQSLRPDTAASQGRPLTGQSEAQQDGTAVGWARMSWNSKDERSDGERTVRQSMVTYPSLNVAVKQMQE